MVEALRVGSLAAVTPAVLCEASNEAFRDYPVSVQMTIAQLVTMLRQNDVDLGLSVGLFDGERLVGFWLNGVRTLAGGTVGYDSGTAIIKPYRGQGWSRKLARVSDELLLERGVREYFLEVLTQNETAYRLYLKSGFRVTRTLLCLRTDRPLDLDGTLPPGMTVEAGPFDAALVSDFPEMEYRPSWQHMTPSMVNIQAEVHAVIVRSGDRIVGHGMIIPDRGRITQLAVAEHLWDGPVPGVILGQLCNAAGPSAILANNVDPGARRTLDLLRGHGFEPYAEQYEMARSL